MQKRRFPSILAALFLTILLSACSQLRIGYEFDPAETFTEIQGAFSNQTITTYKGYMFNFHTQPARPSLPWNNAKLHSPADINGGNDELQCYNQVDGNRRTLDFFCGGSATTPATPPTGTYQINVTPEAFTINGVTSKTIAADLTNIYLPAIKLMADGSGKIIRIDWQWWKNSANGWIQPTESELASELDRASYVVGRTHWAGDPATDRVSGEMPLTPTGNLVPAMQSFTPGALRISFSDAVGYGYGFEWR